MVCGITSSVPQLILCGTDLPGHNCSQLLLELIRGQKRESLYANCHACFRAKAAYYSLECDIDIRIVGGMVEHMSSLKKVTGTTSSSLHNQISNSVNLNRGACNGLTKSL